MVSYPDQQRSWAVLVGTSDYEESSHLDHLPDVHSHLVALEQALTHPTTGVFAPDRCMVVDNPDSPKASYGDSFGPLARPKTCFSSITPATESPVDLKRIFTSPYGDWTRNCAK
ncbi:hypothetical protein [Amycolatopsis sp. cmx-4-68]|uniref:hypothetical protein n=1 Tax=Amycolatopsis sp. cmx-4-68 TaxID=2790938 RepID=UPI003978B24C